MLVRMSVFNLKEPESLVLFSRSSTRARTKLSQPTAATEEIEGTCGKASRTWPSRRGTPTKQQQLSMKIPLDAMAVKRPLMR